MRPAFSVIFLTTLIGVGQGLFLALVGGQFYWAIGGTQAQESGDFFVYGSVLVLAFLSLGLLASFFHLAHPERAWRAASQWRTSWLSREVVALPAVMGSVFLYAALHWFDINPVLVTFANSKTLDLTMTMGYAGAAATLVLFVCTGMIYGCMKFIQEWATPLTVLNFFLMGSASGLVLATVYAHVMASALTELYAGFAIAMTILALIGRVASLIRNGNIKYMSSLQSAVGLHHRNLRQVTRGFTAGAFNLKEFFHPGGPGLVAKLSAFYLVAAFALPVLLMMVGLSENIGLWFGLAFVVQYVGLIAERWVFFAEATHPQNLYYQKVA